MALSCDTDSHWSDPTRGFNGQLRTDEIAGKGNHIAFDARGYDSRLGRFWSVDPLAAKYPNQSPYGFVGNSPIMNREIDGRDYDVAIDHKSRTITIKATYIVPTQNDVKGMQVMNTGITFWNNQNGNFKYQVGKGKTATYYDVKFDLKPAEVQYGEKSYTLSPGQPTSNVIMVIGNENFDKAFPKQPDESVEGVNTRNELYMPERNAEDKIIPSHEMGHGLGIFHNLGLMSAHYGNERVTKQSVSNVLGGAGVGQDRALQQSSNEKIGKAINIQSQGTAPESFDEGKVIYSPR